MISVRRIALSVAVVLTIGLLSGAGQAGSGGTPQVRALFFGDSLVAGVGALPRRPVMARSAADRLGWFPVVDAVGGTGYTTGGRRGHPYLERFRHDGYLDTPYDVVVLEGGTNDAHHGSLTQLRASALRTVDYVRSRQPKARIVLVGAFAPAGVRLARYAAVDEILQGVATSRDLQYVSQLGFSASTDPDFLSSDAFHPSGKGYDLMGRELADALKN